MVLVIRCGRRWHFCWHLQWALCIWTKLILSSQMLSGFHCRCLVWQENFKKRVEDLRKAVQATEKNRLAAMRALAEERQRSLELQVKISRQVFCAVRKQQKSQNVRSWLASSCQFWRYIRLFSCIRNEKLHFFKITQAFHFNVLIFCVTSRRKQQQLLKKKFGFWRYGLQPLPVSSHVRLAGTLLLPTCTLVCIGILL